MGGVYFPNKSTSLVSAFNVKGSVVSINDICVDLTIVQSLWGDPVNGAFHPIKAQEVLCGYRIVRGGKGDRAHSKGSPQEHYKG